MKADKKKSEIYRKLAELHEKFSRIYILKANYWDQPKRSAKNRENQSVKKR